jgi:hypothetical protein
MFGGDSTGRRFNLTLGIAARNLLNHVNYALPDGDMSAGPRFGQPLAIAGGFGASGSSNRRIDMQLRLTF